MRVPLESAAELNKEYLLSCIALDREVFSELALIVAASMEISAPCVSQQVKLFAYVVTDLDGVFKQLMQLLELVANAGVRTLVLHMSVY